MNPENQTQPPQDLSLQPARPPQPIQPLQPIQPTQPQNTYSPNIQSTQPAQPTYTPVSLDTPATQAPITPTLPGVPQVAIQPENSNPTPAPQPSLAPKQKSKKALWIIISLVILALLAGGIYLVLNGKNNSQDSPLGKSSVNSSQRETKSTGKTSTPNPQTPANENKVTPSAPSGIPKDYTVNNKVLADLGFKKPIHSNKDAIIMDIYTQDSLSAQPTKDRDIQLITASMIKDANKANESVKGIDNPKVNQEALKKAQEYIKSHTKTTKEPPIQIKASNGKKYAMDCMSSSTEYDKTNSGSNYTYSCAIQFNKGNSSFSFTATSSKSMTTSKKIGQSLINATTLNF